jgi:hypothetical protein
VTVKNRGCASVHPRSSVTRYVTYGTGQWSTVASTRA